MMIHFNKRLPKSGHKFLERLKQYEDQKETKGQVIMDIPTTSLYEYATVLQDLFLGEDWYVADPLCSQQAATLALDDILYKYCWEYRKAVKKYKKRKRRMIWKS